MSDLNDSPEYENETQDPTPEERAAAKDAEKREQARTLERHRWWELRETYARCVEIAESVWGDRLEAAQVVQQRLVEDMRDRRVNIPVDNDPNFSYREEHSIAAPLFTPRDRLQFLKEVATTLMISADRRNLAVTKEGRNGEPQLDALSGRAEPSATAVGAALQSADVSPTSYWGLVIEKALRAAYAVDRLSGPAEPKEDAPNTSEAPVLVDPLITDLAPLP